MKEGNICRVFTHNRVRFAWKVVLNVILRSYVPCPQSISFVESLQSTGQFSASEEVNRKGNSGAQQDREPEETLAWALYLRAQLEEKTGLLKEANDTLEVNVGRGIGMLVWHYHRRH